MPLIKLVRKKLKIGDFFNFLHHLRKIPRDALIGSVKIQQKAFSKCSHHLCMKCSKKIRKLSKDYKCLIWFAELDKVVTSYELMPFSRIAIFQSCNFEYVSSKF